MQKQPNYVHHCTTKTFILVPFCLPATLFVAYFLPHTAAMAQCCPENPAFYLRFFSKGKTRLNSCHKKDLNSINTVFHVEKQCYQFIICYTSWWFQPIWKILIKFSQPSPIFGVIFETNLSCHHLVYVHQLLVPPNRGAIDHSGPEKAHVSWLHKKLLPAFSNYLLQNISSFEAILHMNGVDHWNALLGALLHITWLVHDPFVVVPSRVVSGVWILLDFLYSPGSV